MKYYCLGIKGTGMSTLAQILYDLGNEVTGYDDVTDYKFTEDGLRERGIVIYHDSSAVISDDCIVTYSVALPQSHPELVRMRQQGKTIKRYNEVVGEITALFETISVSGTHGKTTTSAMLKHLLGNTIGVNYFVGAGDGHVSMDNRVFVIESDEFNRHFLTYHPCYSIITNIEKEHMECYHDLQDIIDTFSLFADHTEKLVIACGDNENTHKLHTKTPVTYYGFGEDNDHVIRKAVYTPLGSRFELDGEEYEIPLFGLHMVQNAAAAVIAAKLEGLTYDEIRDNLRTFRNAHRRMEETDVNGIKIIDDYAHHPTEIAATISAVRQKYPEKKLVAVFKPNTYSRTRDFTTDFAEALKRADQVFMTDIDSNRETQDQYPGVTSDLVLDLIPGAVKISDKNVEAVEADENTVVLVMSCASVSHLMESLIGHLKQKLIGNK